MKILYAIQGTGNGHISRALEIIPILKKFGKLDLFVSGENCEVKLPYEVKYRSKGITFYYNKKGGIDYWKTIRKLRFILIWKEILTFPVQDYDLVINDYESISAFACKLRNVPMLALGHQAAFKSPHCPRPNKLSRFGEFCLKSYAPSQRAIGFHFEPYDSFIHTPVIRSQVRDLFTMDMGHITVYLSAYDDAVLINHFRKLPRFKFHLFSKKAKESYVMGNCTVFPVENETFLKSLATCHGFLSGAGFEGPAEALFLKKKVMVIPIKGQYEQYCNAVALAKMGVPVIERITGDTLLDIQRWITSDWNIKVNYPDITEQILEKAIFTASANYQHANAA